MEKMAYQPELEGLRPWRREMTTSNWRKSLPVLAGSIRPSRAAAEDAPTLLAMLSTEEVARFISPPPTTVEGFEHFIAWTPGEREEGNHICYGVVPAGLTSAVGLFQFRALEPGFRSCEWGFALGSQFWGTGLFMDGAARAEFRVDALDSIVSRRGRR